MQDPAPAPLDALHELITLAGLEEPYAGQVEIRGADPVLPTRYRVTKAGAASIAAAGFAAAELWRLRTGSRQRIEVDGRAATAALRSGSYLKIDGVTPQLWDPLSGFFPVRDGRFIRLHCNFPGHRGAALGVLRASCEPEAVAAASRIWDGPQLEDAIHAAGGCAGFVRTCEEWESHPQARAVRTQALLDIRQIGRAPPEPLPRGARPLANVRVLDLTRVLAGPTCGRALAEHGADVLKIAAAHLPDSGPVELDTGLGKLSAYVDLRTAAGCETLRNLLQQADVFVQSYRPGSLASRGFGPEQSSLIRPGIVHVSLSAWGEAGPWCARRGFDSIVQAVSGMAHESARDGRPRLLPVSAIDYVSGYLMAYGAMVALKRRAEVGGSWLVSVSLARTGQWIVDFGAVEQGLLHGVAPDLDDEEIQRLTEETVVQDKTVRHLKPTVALSETPPWWERPPAPLGSHRPEWPERR